MNRKRKRIPTPPYIEIIAALSTTASPCPQIMIAAKWAQKLSNLQTGIMDMGATSGAASKQDIKALSRIQA
jgi:hypothetical protein